MTLTERTTLETFSPSRSRFAVYTSCTQDKEASPGMNLSQLLSPRFSAAHDTPLSSSPMFTAGMKFRRMATTLFAGSQTDEEDDVTTITSDMPDLVTEPLRLDLCSVNKEASRNSSDFPHVDTVKNQSDEEMEAHYW